MKHFYNYLGLIAFIAMSLWQPQIGNAQDVKRISTVNHSVSPFKNELVPFDDLLITRHDSKASGPKAAITDIDGNIYDTVRIGTQLWLKQNLRTTRLSDGTAIDEVTDAETWSLLTTPGLSWYNNDQASYGATYGALYNWYAVNTEKLCPTGWRVSSDEDWKTMEMYLGMTSTDADAFGWRGSGLGNMIKSTEGWTINTGTNTTGFSAYPAGYRNTVGDGAFLYLGTNTGWWSVDGSGNIINRGLDYIYSTIARTNSVTATLGSSVRCLKNEHPVQSFGGGSGTQADPYWVENAAQLNNVRNYLSSYFIQTDTIDLSGSPWSDQEGWHPIGQPTAPFTGNYNGNNFAINGLTINTPDSNFVGLFGVAVGAVFSNIAISGNVTGSWDVGMLVGLLKENGSIANCWANGKVTGEIFVGGLAGYLYSYSACAFSYSKGRVIGVNGDDGSQQLGGLIGRVREYSSVNQCYSTSDIQMTGYWKGGLVGLVTSNSEVNNSYSTGSVSGDGYLGGLLGGIQNSGFSNSYSVGKVQPNMGGGLIGDENITGASVLNAYWNTETSGYQTSPLGEAKTTLELVTTTSFAGWDLSGTWAMSDGITYPYLVWQGSPESHNYPVQSIPPSNLTAVPSNGSIALNWNVPSMGSVLSYYIYRDGSYYTSTTSNSYADVGLSNYIPHQYYVSAYYSTGYESTGSNLVKTFSHTGFSGGSGTLDDPYLISTAGELSTVGLYLNSNFKQIADIDLGAYPWNSGEGWQPIGGFGNSFSGTYDGGDFSISNLFIDRQTQDAVGLFGQTYNAVISNLTILSATIYGDEYVGILAGDINYSTIKNVSAAGNITANSVIGGLVGGNYTSNIEHSKSTGTINNNGNWVGGIAGISYNKATIKSCSSSVNATAKGYSAGGLTGTCELLSTLSDSYSIGSVSADRFVGGLVGWCDSSAVTNCYAIGLVTGNTYFGGLIGNASANSTFTNSYWNYETSGQASSGGGEGRSSVQMQYPHNDGTTYLGWDFSSVWNYDVDNTVNNGYPYLRQNLVSLPTIVSYEITAIDYTTAVAGGNITSDGGSPVTARGVVWATYSMPTLETNAGSYLSGSGTGEFTANLTNLVSGNKYYVRAYATNSAGTAYSNEVSFITKSDYLTITFNCNLNREINLGIFNPLTDTLYVTGVFANEANPAVGWDKPGTGKSLRLIDSGGTGIYSGNVSVSSNYGAFEYKYFINYGWDKGEWAGGTNRSIEIGATNLTLNDKFGVVNSSVIFDPAELYAPSLPSGFQKVLIGDKYYLEVNLNGWGTMLQLMKAIDLPTDNNQFKCEVMYVENGSGYLAENLQAFIEIVGEIGSEEKFQATQNPAPTVLTEIYGSTNQGWPNRYLHIAAQDKLSGNWDAITGGIMYVGKIEAYHYTAPNYSPRVTYLSLKTNSTTTIDGYADEAGWSTATNAFLDQIVISNNGHPTSTDDNSASFKSMWDNNNLYLYINVNDDNVISPSDINYWLWDNVEVFVDIKDRRYESPRISAEQHQLRFNPGRSDCDAGTFGSYLPQWNYLYTEKGYAFEIALPWQGILQGHEDITDMEQYILDSIILNTKNIAFEMQVGDDDLGGSRHSMLAWSNNTGVDYNYLRTQYWGRITLNDPNIASKPTISSVSHYNVTTNSASLVGTVNAEGDGTTVLFRYGETSSFGLTSTPTPSTVTGNSNTNVTAVLTGLKSGQIYYYQLEATNSIGTVYSAVKSFTTSNCSEQVTISGAQTLCSGAQNVSYTATSYSGAVYNWAVEGGTVASGQGSNSITVNWNSTTINGIVSVSVQISAECSASDDLGITLSGSSSLPTPEIYNKGPLHILICTVPNMKYKWYKNGQEIGGETNQFYVARNNAGNYSVAISNNTDCWAFSEQIIVSGQKSMLIYPNPIHDKTVVTYDNDEVGKGTIKVLDVFGKTVYVQSFNKPETGINQEIDLSHLTKGVYVIELLVNDIKCENQQIVIN